MAPKFGIKEYVVLEKPFYHGEPTEANPVRKLLRVEFLNGRVYHSYWREDMPCSMLYSNLHNDECHQQEQDMEFLVVEQLCESILNPESK